MLKHVLHISTALFISNKQNKKKISKSKKKKHTTKREEKNMHKSRLSRSLSNISITPEKQVKTTNDNDDPLMKVHMMKHTEISSSRISFGQGGSVIEIELSCGLNPKPNRNRGRSACFPEFISLQTHNGRYRMVLHHANGQGPVYALYAVNWVSRGFSDPLRLPEAVLSDFCSALLGLSFEIQIQPEVHDHFRYTCARNVFATIDCSSDGQDESDLWYKDFASEEKFSSNIAETQQSVLIASLPIETSLTFLPAHDVLDMSMSSIERLCRLKEPAVARSFCGRTDIRTDTNDCLTEYQPANVFSVTAQHFRNNRQTRFLSQQAGSRTAIENGTTVCVLKVECGNLEKHALRTQFYQNLLVMNHLQNPLTQYRIPHSICPNLISKGSKTWSGQQFFFFECIQPVSPLYMMLGTGGDHDKSQFFSRKCRNRCSEELEQMCHLFSADSNFLLLYPGSDAEFAENFLVNSDTGEVYIWSFRDAVYFNGNKVSALGFHDHSQKFIPSQLETFRSFVAGLRRLAELVASE